MDINAISIATRRLSDFVKSVIVVMNDIDKRRVDFPRYYRKARMTT
jgi:hypothetical protein